MGEEVSGEERERDLGVWGEMKEKIGGSSSHGGGLRVIVGGGWFFWGSKRRPAIKPLEKPFYWFRVILFSTRNFTLVPIFNLDKCH